jgi:hypothetical protein
MDNGQAMKQFDFFHDDSGLSSSSTIYHRHTSRSGMLGCARQEALKLHQTKLRAQLAFIQKRPHHLGVRETVHEIEGWGTTTLYVMFKRDEDAVEWIFRFA